MHWCGGLHRRKRTFTPRRDNERPDGRSFVHPPAGSDVYLIARLWQWWPMLELEEGKTYRLHLASMDWLHGFSLQPENINIEVHPELRARRHADADQGGHLLDHLQRVLRHQPRTMASRLYVVKPK